MLAATSAGVALQRLYPPGQQGNVPTRLVYLIGYDLPDHLVMADLALRWRWDVVFGPTAVIAAVGYLAAVRRLTRRGGFWPATRTMAWLAGCAVLLIATSSGIGAYAPAMFSVHMVQHTLLATLVPVLLVLGHGVGLLLEVSGPQTQVRVESLLDAPALRFLCHPIVALCAVSATLFLLYPTGFYASIAQEHWAHICMNIAFLGTGLALYWPVLGYTFPGGGIPPLGRLVMIFAVMGLHSGFSVWLLAQSGPIAQPFFTSVHLSFVHDLLADQRSGAIFAWILGEIPTAMAVGALVIVWSTADRRIQPAWLLPDRSDRVAEL